MGDGDGDGSAGMPGIGVVILAAGAATRMGAVKQLLPFRERSLLRHTTEEALSSGCRPIVVVLGAHAERLEEEIRDLPVQAVMNPRWPEGMGTSIHAGIAAVTTDPGVDAVRAVVLAVCDQPFFSAEIIHELVAAHQQSGSAIVAALYASTRGVPALFDRSLFPELLALDGHEGARRVIQARLGETIDVPFPGGALDLDTPEDFARLSALGGRDPGSPLGPDGTPLRSAETARHPGRSDRDGASPRRRE